jgi:putative flavoprotein involved in K+ transport
MSGGVSRPERFETIVIGAGQAGLATGYHLAKRGVRFLILEGGLRVGDSWRQRWDGLRLFTRARYDGLPGMAFPAPPNAFPTKDEVADFLESYAEHMALPVRTGVRVEELGRTERDDGYLIVAAGQRYEAARVVVATGAFGAPRIPGFAAELDPAIRQLHASEYRNPSQLRDGPVLVVGASNSGAEIAMSAAREHRTTLSGRNTGKMPFRPEGRMARLFDVPFWFFINRVATTRTPIGRKARPFILNYGGPLERVWPEDLAAAGVERVYARTVAADGGLPVLADGRLVEVTNVIWCTGFRPAFDWIRLPVFADDGWPQHVRGVVLTAPGLYFVGLPFLYSAASPLLGGVGRDAAYIASRVASQATARAPERNHEAAAVAGR